VTLAAALDLLVCPRCRQPLSRVDGSVRCSRGHGYDVARQGYLNLGSGPPPGHADTAAMVAARSAFLQEGHFRAVSDTVGAVVPEQATTILDCGAGPGHHVARLLDGGAGRRGVALDVSVAAVRRAARAHDRLAAVVADVWRALPVADGVLDVVLSVFAPRNPAEFRRVLAPKGIFVTVVPTSEHLLELREPLNLLDVEPAKAERLEQSLDGRFRAADRHEVSVRTSWDRATARAAVLMGPNAFHLQAEEMDRRLDGLSWPRPVTVSCTVDAWTPV
jgi:23S rRNA (guanine745-N1)-methyltransferase